MQETQERFFIFIDKLKEKATTFAEDALPELSVVFQEDKDVFKREYLRMKQAILGQLESILQKARDVQEEKVTNFPNSNSQSFTAEDYYTFRNKCYQKLHELEELCRTIRAQIEATFVEDYEAKYQAIVVEFERNKDKFKCSQCGSSIQIDKLYFISTYITCPSCNTQNTYQPSSQAQLLETLGRQLAEQRTKHLLDAYDEDGTRSLELYQRYLRAMFDEWNKITPDLTTEHEKFYSRLLNDHKRYNYE